MFTVKFRETTAVYVCFSSTSPGGKLPSPVIRTTSVAPGRSSVHAKHGQSAAQPFPRNTRERRTYHGPPTSERQRRTATYNGPPPTSPPITECVPGASGRPDGASASAKGAGASREGGFLNKLLPKFNRR